MNTEANDLQPEVGGVVQLSTVTVLVFKPALVSPFSLFSRRSQVIEKFEALDIENAEHMETNVSAGAALSSETRQGRSEKRVFPRKRVSCSAEVSWWGLVGGTSDLAAQGGGFSSRVCPWVGQGPNGSGCSV